MINIDLNKADALTIDAVRQLLASASDDVHTQLRVTKAGIAYLSVGVVGGADIDGLLFRLETWAAASGYVGNVAASDEVWVMQIFNALKRTGPILLLTTLTCTRACTHAVTIVAEQ